MNRVIGLLGNAGAGKTTAANHLVARYKYVRRPFARPLKQMLLAVGLSQEHTDGALKNEPCDLLCGTTPRHALQTLGTDWGRDMISPDLWVTLWLADATRTPMPVVADDVRFQNEADAIRSLGGIVVKIDRPSVGRTSDHASETEMDTIRCDRLVRNLGDLDDLCASLMEVVQHVG